jgi:hypothetical protein
MEEQLTLVLRLLQAWQPLLLPLLTMAWQFERMDTEIQDVNDVKIKVTRWMLTNWPVDRIVPGWHETWQPIEVLLGPQLFVVAWLFFKTKSSSFATLCISFDSCSAVANHSQTNGQQTHCEDSKKYITAPLLPCTAPAGGNFHRTQKSMLMLHLSLRYKSVNISLLWSVTHNIHWCVEMMRWRATRRKDDAVARFFRVMSHCFSSETTPTYFRTAPSQSTSFTRWISTLRVPHHQMIKYMKGTGESEASYCTCKGMFSFHQSHTYSVS